MRPPMSSIRQFILKILCHPAIVEVASYLIWRRPTRIDQARWDREYATVRLDHLGDITETPRFSLIAGYSRNIAAATSMLDIGCGDGRLSSLLCPDTIHCYVGIDIANIAIRKARERGVRHARFEVADAATFDPGARFDIIVFSEVLYYMANPELVLDRYEDFLTPAGVFIISMWRSTGSLRTWRRCAARLKVLDEVRLRAANKLEWDVRLCQPIRTLTESKE